MTTPMYPRGKKYIGIDRFYEHCTCTMAAIFRSDLEKNFKDQIQDTGTFIKPGKVECL